MIPCLHGFLSSSASRKAQALARRMRELGIADRLAIPSLPPHPSRAIELLESAIERISAKRLTVVGSSLGGYYATHLAEKHGCRAVLINPAVRPYELLRDYFGPQSNLYTGEEFVVAESGVAALREIDVPRITCPERYLLLVETGDEVLDYAQAVEKFPGAKQIVIEGGDHSFASFEHYLPVILEFAGETSAPGL
jgi:uncharacterized protein